jgi:AAA domain/Nuclease-related domain/UvrD-like helicase C-terminal domain
MLPSRADGDAPDSERKVFAAFERHLPRDWIVFHSRRIVLPRQGAGPVVEYELDFLIIDPARGLLGLEVKGGVEIGRDADGWYSGGAPRHRIKAPGQQAQRAMHGLENYIRTRAEVPAFGWGVVFPDAELPAALGPELPTEVVIDREGLQWVDKAIDGVFQAAVGAGSPLSPAAVAQLVQLLAPRVSLAPSLAATITHDGAALVRLTEEQFTILEVLSGFPRVGVSGGAGTGKTLVAMERARRLTVEGQKVLLLCYNRGLAAYLKPRADGFDVSTFHALCDVRSKMAGLPWPDAPAGPEAQSFWREEAPSLLLRALDRLPDERYDAVIVDEAQDFHEYWWLAVERLLKRPKDDVLWVFVDPRQNIYDGSAWEALGLRTAPLTYNCRNTQRIARYAYGLVNAEPRLRPGTPEGIEVSIQRCSGESEMLDAVRRALHRIVIAGRLPTDSLVVLSPRSEKTSAVWRAGTFGNLRLVAYPTPAGQGEVQFATLQRFKGLEADAVVLCESQTGQPHSSGQHLYVAASRARHVLEVAEYVQPEE